MAKMMNLLAQSAPSDGKLIQRTIVVEGEEPITPEAATAKQVGGSIAYGMAAILLLLVAVAGIVIFWSKYSLENRKPAPKRPTKIL